MSELSDEANPDSGVRKSRSWRWLLVLVAVFVLAVVGMWAAIQFTRIEQSFARGKTLLRQRRESEAEQALETYLRWHPREPAAILSWAEAVVSGNSRTPEDAAELAMSRLSTIPDDSTFGAEARMREGRLALLIVHQANRAEKLLTRSAELNPDVPDTHYLLWKLFDMTERFHDAEPHFRRAFELTPDDMKTDRLREWYLSQFSPPIANAELNRRMGFLSLEEAPTENSELKRLVGFLVKEPKSTMVVAANARWLIQKRQRDEALKLLLEVSELEESMKDPHYLSAMVNVLIDLARLKEARTYFEKWPPPYEGFLYLNTAGRVFELVDRNDKLAVDAYDKALSLWPGPADWSLMHRKAQCLARLGDRDGAEAVRREAKRIELLMEPEIHQGLRLALADLNRRESLQQMVDFYQSLHREPEAMYWQEAIDRLPDPTASVYSPR